MEKGNTMNQPTGPGTTPPLQPSKKVTAAKTILSLFKKNDTHYIARHLLLFLVMFYSILTFVGYWKTTPTGVKWWVVVLVAMVCNLLGAIKVVSEREQAVSIFLGIILEPLKSGPHLIPWPMRLERATINSIKVDFGTLDDSLVEGSRKNDDAALYVMEEPIRINWGDIDCTDNITPEERKMYEDSQYAHEITTDPHLFFVMNIGNLIRLIRKAGSLENALKLIKDACVAALTEKAGGTFVAKARKEVGQLVTI